MLDIKKLCELRLVLNLKGVCRISDVNYYTIKNKTLRHKENAENGK